MSGPLGHIAAGEEMGNYIYLGLGSNLGDSATVVSDAARGLIEKAGEGELSRLYRTSPRHDLDQAEFINAVVRLPLFLPPRELLTFIGTIESDYKRTRDPSRPKGPRTLDIDILLYGRRIIESKELIIPHPRMQERQFVLVPLLELAPRLRCPISGTLYADQAAELETQGIYYFSLKDYSNSLSWEG